LRPASKIRAEFGWRRAGERASAPPGRTGLTGALEFGRETACRCAVQFSHALSAIRVNRAPQAASTFVECVFNRQLKDMETCEPRASLE